MQERQDNIINCLAAQMKQTFQEEDERVARAVAEKEAAWEEELKEKEEKHTAELKSIAEYRATVVRILSKKEEFNGTDILLGRILGKSSIFF